MRTPAGRKDIPGRGKSKFKGPEVRTCPGCWRSNTAGRTEGSWGRGEEAELRGPWEGPWLYSERKGEPF